MKIENLETTGIRLIGFYFLFSTAYHVSGAVMASYYEVNDPDYESLIAAMANAATITQAILSVLVLLLSFIAMFRPHSIQSRWKTIGSENRDAKEPCVDSLILLRMAALIMALYFGQKSLSDFIEITLFSNISFSGFNAARATSNLTFLVISLYLFMKPEVMNKWK